MQVPSSGQWEGVAATGAPRTGSVASQTQTGNEHLHLTSGALAWLYSFSGTASCSVGGDASVPRIE